MTAVTHPPYPARRGGARARSWWGKAWVRAVEESAYDERGLRAGRTLARAGATGGLTVDAGTVVAAVRDRDQLHAVRVVVPVWDPADRAAFVEVVAAESGRVAALLAGELPHALVEHAEEAGIELLPYGGELESTCTCDGWLQPCTHALAVLSQVAWLVDDDPLELLRLRGLARDELLAALHETSLADGGGPDDGGDVDLDLAVEAARHAARVLAAVEDADR